ncbi:O-antigen ligase family protein [Lysobacter koreensis]|uniref:O-antigen ligase family protein n=1 Tax=Lysobacter koreensis TaxID=266122 RepID=A0ABW2YHM4_9GAMM
MFRRALLAIPIVLMPNSLHVPFDTGLAGLNVANLLLIVLLLSMPARRPDMPPPAPGILRAPLLLLFASLVIGLLIALATRPGTLVTDLTDLKNFIFYPLLYFVYRHCRQDLAGTRQLLALMLVVAIVAGLESVGEGIARDSFSSFDDSKRIAGPFGGARVSNRAGVFFAMFLPLLVAFALFVRGRRIWRLIAIAGIVVLVVAIMVTFSRQSYLIAVVTTALLLLRRHLLLAGLLAVAMVPAISLLPEGVTQRVVETQQLNEIGEAELDVSTASRFDIWDGAMRMWRDNPAGVGFGRFPSYIGSYSDYEGYDAHNMYVLMLAECGPLGLIAMLWLLWRLLKLAITVRRSSDPDDRESQALALGFGLAVVAMAMGNLYGSSFNEGLVMANFWILCGLVEHYATLKRHARTSPVVAPAPVTDAIYQRFPMAGQIAPGLYRPQEK